MARFYITGQADLKRRLRELERRKPKAVGKALYNEAEQIMTAAKQITPVATPELSGYSGGALRASGHVKLPQQQPGGLVVELGFGGAAAPYAVYVHEIPPPPQKSEGGRSARHNPPTQWKFLEMPLKAATAGMLGRLAARLKDEF